MHATAAHVRIASLAWCIAGAHAAPEISRPRISNFRLLPPFPQTSLFPLPPTVPARTGQKRNLFPSTHEKNEKGITFRGSLPRKNADKHKAGDLGWLKREKGFVFGPFLLSLLTKTVCSTVCSHEWCSVVMIVVLGGPEGGG